MGFRSTLWFCFVPLYNFLTPGTITGPLVPGIKAVRGRALVAGYIVYIALLCRAMLSPSIGAAEVLPPLALLAVMAPFDFVIAECSRAEHYGYMLFALAFSDSWLFGLQIVQIGLWTGLIFMWHTPNIRHAHTSESGFRSSDTAPRAQ